MKKMMTGAMAFVALMGLAACSKTEETPEVQVPETGTTVETATPDVNVSVFAENIQHTMSAYMDGELQVVDGVLEAYMNIDLMGEEGQALYGEIFNPDFMTEGVMVRSMMNVNSNLIIIVEAKDEEQRLSVASAFDTIWAQEEANWSTYLPDQHEKVLNGQLVQNGNYLMLVIFDETQILIDAFTQTANGTFEMPVIEPKAEETDADLEADTDAYLELEVEDAGVDVEADTDEVAAE